MIQNRHSFSKFTRKHAHTPTFWPTPPTPKSYEPTPPTSIFWTTPTTPFFLTHAKIWPTPPTKPRYPRHPRYLADSVLPYISYILAYLLLWLSKHLQAKNIKLPEDDWSVKTNGFLIGDFKFILNTDWMTKKQLNVNSINHFYK